MKKKIIGTVIFLALAAGLLWKLNGVFSLKQEDGIVPMELFYEQEPGSIDVMFYGSSHTYSDINPAVLWEEQGIPSYDLAGSLQPLWNTYYYMKESLKYQRPQVMVVELVRAIESREHIEEARTITNTFGMKLSKEKVENVQVSTAGRTSWITCWAIRSTIPATQSFPGRILKPIRAIRTAAPGRDITPCL